MGIAYGQVFGRKHDNIQPIYAEKPKPEKPHKAVTKGKTYVKGNMAGKPWTIEELEMMYDESIPFTKIAKDTGRSYRSVADYASLHGFPTPPSRYKNPESLARVWTEHDMEVIRDMSKNITEAALEIGCSCSTVHKKRKKLGL